MNTVCCGELSRAYQNPLLTMHFSGSFVNSRKAKLPQYKQDEKALNALLDKELHGEYHVPLAYVDAMTIPNKQLLVQSLLRKDDLGGGTKKSKIFFAHTMHGLGNRIRALGSSLAVAKKTNRYDLTQSWLCPLKESKPCSSVSAQLTHLLHGFEMSETVTRSGFLWLCGIWINTVVLPSMNFLRTNIPSFWV